MEIAATQRWVPDHDGDLVGSLINDRYAVTGRLGHGASAEVYRAHDRQLEREVAIKILTRQLCAEPGSTARFQDEGLLTAKVHHPNVAAVFDTGTFMDRPFIVMECLSGGTLADRIARGPIAVEDVRAIAVQLLGALQAAHDVGVVHRDVKPSNILLSATGVAKLADFGIAKDDAQADRTAVGLVVGTPSYMAPERLRGGPATARSDIYALGVVMHDALRGPRSAGVDRPEDDARMLVPSDPGLSSVMARATQPDPSLRFVSATEMLGALEQVQDRATAPTQPMPVRPRRIGARARVFAAAALVTVLIVVAAVFGSRADDSPPASGPTTTDPVPSPLRDAIDELREAVGS